MVDEERIKKKKKTREDDYGREVEGEWEKSLIVEKRNIHNSRQLFRRLARKKRWDYYGEEEDWKKVFNR